MKERTDKERLDWLDLNKGNLFIQIDGDHWCLFTPWLKWSLHMDRSLRDVIDKAMQAREGA